MPEVLEKDAAVSGTDVNVPTTTETVIISSGQVPVPVETCQVLIKAWAQLTIGAGATAVMPVIRQGTGVSGTQVGEGNWEQVKTAPGSTEAFFIMARERREHVAYVQYSLTLAQFIATGNGTVLQAGIEVEVLNG